MCVCVRFIISTWPGFGNGGWVGGPLGNSPRNVWLLKRSQHTLKIFPKNGPIFFIAAVRGVGWLSPRGECNHGTATEEGTLHKIIRHNKGHASKENYRPLSGGVLQNRLAAHLHATHLHICVYINVGEHRAQGNIWMGATCIWMCRRLAGIWA